MIDNTLIPEPNGSETPAAGNDSSEVEVKNESSNESGEFDLEKSDNLASIREYAKGLKTDLGTFKPVYEFVKDKFGDVKNAEVAHSLYKTFADEEFDPESFEKILSQLSPQRTNKLFETKASTKAEELAQAKIKELFGGEVTPDEIKRYKDWVKSGYGLGDGDDIPDALKFDSQGNPKSDEEIQFLRDLQKAAKDKRNSEEAERQAKLQEAEEQKEIARQTRVNEFSNARLEVLNKELDILGLKDLPTDTAQEKESKSLLRNFILNGVSGIYLNSEAAKDFHAAMKHLNEDEVLLARKYEANIEDGLLKILRSDDLKSIFEALAKPDEIHDGRPEISNTASPSNPEEGKPKAPESANDLYARLVKEGKIKPD